MTGISNFHTHTTFCDGKNTAEEMVQAAIRAGCPALGFSGHSHVAFDADYCMPPGAEAYRREILRLKEAYAGKIRILLGLELDYYSQTPAEQYDYLIGSVHYILKDGEYIPVDMSRDTLLQAAVHHYGGDFYAMAEDYYRLVEDVQRRTRCNIVGHMDLITKFNEPTPLFDESHPRYQAAALGALDSLLSQGALLEINTGAISRGYRTTPYPAVFLLEEMGRRGAKAILSSDCHSADAIVCGFERATSLAGRCGVVLVDSPV